MWLRETEGVPESQAERQQKLLLQQELEREREEVREKQDATVSTRSPFGLDGVFLILVEGKWETTPPKPPIRTEAEPTSGSRPTLC